MIDLHCNRDVLNGRPHRLEKGDLPIRATTWRATTHKFRELVGTFRAKPVLCDNAVTGFGKNAVTCIHGNEIAPAQDVFVQLAEK